MAPQGTEIQDLDRLIKIVDDMPIEDVVDLIYCVKFGSESPPLEFIELHAKYGRKAILVFMVLTTKILLTLDNVVRIKAEREGSNGTEVANG